MHRISVAKDYPGKHSPPETIDVTITATPPSTATANTPHPEVTISSSSFHHVRIVIENAALQTVPPGASTFQSSPSEHTRGTDIQRFFKYKAGWVIKSQRCRIRLPIKTCGAWRCTQEIKERRLEDLGLRCLRSGTRTTGIITCYLLPGPKSMDVKLYGPFYLSHATSPASHGNPEETKTAETMRPGFERFLHSS